MHSIQLLALAGSSCQIEIETISNLGIRNHLFLFATLSFFKLFIR